MTIKLKKIIKGRIHCIDKDILYVSQGHKILISDSSIVWKGLTIFPCNLSEKIKSSNKYGQRLFRSGIQHILKINNNSILVIAYGRIQVFNLKTKKWASSHKLVGKRPLVITQSQNLICYGEYHSNNNKMPMKIMASKNFGVSWFSIYEFENIRHIHGISWDPFLKKFWITTGDNNKESAIWIASEDFTDIQEIVNNSQQARAVQLMISENEVFYATDTPWEENFIYKIDKNSFSVTQLNKIESSVFYSTKVNNELFFSTVCEPSNVNEKKFVNLYQYHASIREWRNELSFKKDFLSMKYFQYGQITFPSGENLTNKLYFTPMSCKYDGWVVEGSLNE